MELQQSKAASMAKAEGERGEEERSHTIDKARSHRALGAMVRNCLLLSVQRKGEPVLEFGAGMT